MTNLTETIRKVEAGLIHPGVLKGIARDRLDRITESLRTCTGEIWAAHRANLLAERESLRALIAA